MTAGSRKVPVRNACDRRHTYHIIIIIIIIIMRRRRRMIIIYTNCITLLINRTKHSYIFKF